MASSSSYCVLGPGLALHCKLFNIFHSALFLKCLQAINLQPGAGANQVFLEIFRMHRKLAHRLGGKVILKGFLQEVFTWGTQTASCANSNSNPKVYANTKIQVMADQLAELLTKLEIQEEYGGELNEDRQFNIDGKIVLCEEAERLMEDPQYLSSVTTLRKKAIHSAADWQQSVKNLVEIQLGGLPYNTLRLKVGKHGALQKGDSISASFVANLDFNREVIISAREPILALIDEFAHEFVAGFLELQDPEEFIQRAHVDEKIAKLLDAVGDKRSFTQVSKLALKGFWESGQATICGRGAKENQMQKLRIWMDVNSRDVFMDLMKATILRSYTEMQKIVHFVVIHPRASKPKTPTKKVKSVGTVGGKKEMISGPLSGGKEQGEDVMAGLIRKKKETIAGPSSEGKKQGKDVMAGLIRRKKTVGLTDKKAH
ncbi:hypothetical protein N431DRAFT_442475 [Stipitochalara longipes BDJ]|nr:hypothetical protein N431DRAFT_442475 [Stipitochalara longipes BDJ]